MNLPITLGNVELAWINQEAECLRFRDLVYVKTVKAASTYYTSMLEHNGWCPCRLDSVDWHKDVVFGFIMDPVQRYLKALTEDAHVPEVRAMIDHMLAFQNHHICVLTHHALPMSLVLGDLIHHVHWIPIDTDRDPDEMLQRLCDRHGVTIDLCADQVNRHASGDSKLRLFEQIRQGFADGNAHFFRIFAKDIDLYARVCSRLI